MRLPLTPIIGLKRRAAMKAAMPGGKPVVDGPIHFMCLHSQPV